MQLSEDQKGDFRRIFGNIHSSTNEALHAVPRARNKKLITIGDVTSYNAISAGGSPDVIVYDGLESRERTKTWMKNFLDAYMGEEHTLQNPAGHIVSKAWSVADTCIAAAGKCKVVVKGEEDLTAIPFIVQSPNGTVVLYGLRDRGVVSIVVDDAIKETCRKLLNRMKVKEDKNARIEKLREEQLKEMFGKKGK